MNSGDGDSVNFFGEQGKVIRAHGLAKFSPDLEHLTPVAGIFWFKKNSNAL
jgi:hypothetical protein